MRVFDRAAILWFPRPVMTAAVLLFFSEPMVSAQSLGRILYTGWGQLCSVSENGQGARCLSSGLEYGSPVWNPVVAEIAAEVGRHDTSMEIWILDDQGKRVRSLDRSEGAIRPAWSPDGRFVYALDYGSDSTVLRWPADGDGRTEVVVRGAKGGPFQMLAFSPSGRRAALLTSHFLSLVIADVTPAGFRAVKTQLSGFRYVSQAVWLDEGHILFVGKKESDRGELWELNVSTGTVSRVGIGGLWLRDQLALSPDRKAVVVTASSGEQPTSWSLWRYRLSGGNPIRLTNGSEDIVGSWRP